VIEVLLHCYTPSLLDFYTNTHNHHDHGDERKRGLLADADWGRTVSGAVSEKWLLKDRCDVGIAFKLVIQGRVRKDSE